MACHPSLAGSVRSIGPIGDVEGSSGTSGSKSETSGSGGQGPAGPTASGGSSVAAGDQRKASVPEGFYGKTLNINAEAEAVAAYGGGVRYTRDYKTDKDSLGVVAVGIGARGAGAKSLTALPSLDTIEVGYNWGHLDAPVDIVGSVAFGPSNAAVNFEPGTGINVKYTLNFASIGAYSGVSVMFDDALIPD